jgi:serine/threonine-protein kinase
LATGELAVLDLSTSEIIRLGLPGTSPHYVSTGHLVYAAEDGSVRAVPFDVESLEVTGNPVPLVEGVAASGSGAADFDIAANGRLIYAPGTAAGGGGEDELVWVDRQGGEEVLPMPPQLYDVPKVSADGRRIAVGVGGTAGLDIWVYDAATGAGLRLTRDEEVNRVPVWTPDGQRILFSSTRDAPRPESFTGPTWYGNIYSVSADGSDEAERVTTTDENQGLTGVSPDGQTLVYSHVYTNNDHWEVMSMPSGGSTDATPLVAGPFRQGGGTISPDGRWLAYKSDETGQFEIYIEPFPGLEAKIPVSIGGGTQPAWSHDSSELFYRDNDGMMVAATISDDAIRPVGDRTPLFPAAGYRLGGGFRQYHVAPDGRFLMMRRAGTTSAEGGEAPHINVVLNWFDELRERVPN